MEDKQKPLRTAASKVKDIYNTYLRSDEKAEAPVDEEVVAATTKTDINAVHVHHEHGDSSGDASAENASNESAQALESMQQALTKAEKERDDLRDQLLRKVAEFENFRKRTERERDQLALTVSERVFARMVEVLDDLQAAIEAGRKSDDYASMLNGIEMIYTKAQRLYEEHGVKPLVAEANTPFNVDVHEALMHIPHPEIPEGQIVQQIQRGYTLHDKVIRHAKVVTSAGGESTN